MDALKAQLNQLRILAFAQMSAGLVIGFALFFVIQQQSTPPQEDLGVMAVALLAVAAGCAAVIPILRKSIMGTTALFPAPASVGDRSSPEAAAAEALAAMPRYRTGTIVGIALGEAVVLLGFVLGFLSQDLLKFAPFFVAGEALMLMQMPRLGGLAALVSPASRAALESA